ncbi:MAG: hypothetical protein ACI9LM_004946 [Alteromonadaceae bacterium]|jgi:hypothetical protein
MLRIKRTVSLIFIGLILAGCSTFGGHVPKDPWEPQSCEENNSSNNKDCKDE